MAQLSLYDLRYDDLRELLASWGEAAHAGALWKALYRERVSSLDDVRALPTRLHARLLREAALTPVRAASELASDDGQTRKYLLELEDGQRIETVRMQCQGRVTACLSTQAGCALGCVFCATGQAGFARNLTTGEIVAQALFAARAVPSGQPLRNIVLMGMGEPLLNYEAVMQAVGILGDPRGLAIAKKRITLSTVGIVPGIVRLADEAQPLSLAVSLHGATQARRAALVPVAERWPLDELMAACRYYTTKLARKIFFEWTFIEGENDDEEQARELAQLLRGIEAQVNLIPLNATPGYAGAAAAPESLRRFQATLREAGIPTTIRRRRGIEIAAGCGQLAAH
jgi:23S rRNA (adenine2503-C2)-methyltransferase